KGSPERRVPIADLAGKAHSGELLLGRGSGPPPEAPPHDAGGCVGRIAFGAFAAPTFLAHAARIRLDRETGVVTVLHFAAAHDFGRVVNRTGAEGQVEG